MGEESQNRVDHFWYKLFKKAEKSGVAFEVLPKMVKCALSLCHSNADVERSLSVNKRMVTKQNVSLNEGTIIGLRAVKTAVQKSGGVSKVPIPLSMITAVEKARQLYGEHLKQEEVKKRLKDAEKQREEERKRKLKKNDEVKTLCDKLQKLAAEEQEAQAFMEEAMNVINEGRQKITDALKTHNMVQVEAGNNLISTGEKNQREAKKRLVDIAEEREKVQSQLFKAKKPRK